MPVINLGNIKGVKGDPGISAYQSWLALGNVGTEADYIESLKGLKGDTGDVSQAQLDEVSTIIIEENILGTTYTKGKKVDLEYVRAQQLYLYGQFYKKIRLNQAVKIDCQGDSLTYGHDNFSANKRAKDTTPDDLGNIRVDIDTRASKTYPDALLEKINLIYPNVTVSTRGWSGDSVKDGYLRWVNNTGADATIISYGTNDAQPYSNIAGDLELFLYWYEQLVIKLILQGSMVIIMTPTKNISDLIDLDIFSMAINLFAQKYGIPIVNGDELLSNYEKTIFSDTVHLNGYGYNILGSKLATIFLGSGINGMQRVNNGSKIFPRRFRGDISLTGSTSLGMSGVGSSPPENDTSLANGWAATLNVGGAIYLSFYAEVDDLVVLPYFITSSSNPSTLEVELDFGIDQALHSLSTAINFSNYLLKRPASLINFSTIKTNTQFNKYNHLINADNVELIISRKGWHTLKIKNTSASSYVQIFGVEFLNSDVLKNLKISQQPDIRCSFYDGGTIGSVATTNVLVSDLKAKLNATYATYGMGVPLKLTIYMPYKSVLTYYFVMGGDQPFVPTSPTVRMNLTETPINERTLSGITYNGTTKALTITWGGTITTSSSFTISVA